MLIYITNNINPNCNIIPGFVEIFSKTTLKFYVISKQNLWFSITSTSNSPILFQKFHVSFFCPFVLHNFPPFEPSQVTSI